MQEQCECGKIYRKILTDEKPDVIHFFGTEFLYTSYFIKIALEEGYKDRIVTSIQGLVSVYYDHYSAGLPDYIMRRKTLSEIKGKGDALRQKSFTKDFLTHKRVDNKGEVPQYYVEGHHEGIVTADQFEQVQAELYRRQNMDRYSGVGCFSSIIKCGECGSWYGAKVWHSNDEYRRVIYRCNKKYGKGCKCKTPHITADEIKEMFIKAANELFSEKAEIIENTKAMMNMVCNTDDLDKELGDKVAELNIIAEQMQTAIAENSRMALDQNEYERRYADLTERYNTIKADYDKISEQIGSKKA